MQEQQEAQRELNRSVQGMPFRFFVTPGETREIVIVDDKPDFFRWEHNLQDRRSGRWDVHVPCIDDHANCPVCSVNRDRPAYFGMFLTIIDLTPYTNSNGDEVPFSKKLLVVKPMQQKKIMRYLERHGTLRGMVLEMARSNKKDASIGDPEFIEFMSEDDLLTYETSYVDQENVEHDVICHEPYDYEALFPAMSDEDLRALVGGRPDTGSRRADDRALGRGRSHDNDDDWEDNAQAPTRRVASRRAAGSEVEAQDTEPPVRRSARGAAAAEPATRTTRRAAAAPVEEQDPDIDPSTGAPWDDVPDGGDDATQEQEEAQRPARGTRAARRAPEPEEAQQPARANVSARRAALRRG